jgi:CYTH domain-containing protein
MSEPWKYALPEIERRWLVDAAHLPALGALRCSQITDKYFEGTRLRLRRVQGETAVVYKLCKKYEAPSDAFESITNIYLSAAEHALLDALPGIEIVKSRYHLPEGGAIDRYPAPLDLLLFSVEFETIEAAETFAPARFVVTEVTDDETYSGLELARRAAPDVTRR